MLGLISPLSLMVLCWGLTGAIALTTILSLDRLDLVQEFMAREKITLDAFTGIGIAWICVAFLTYTVGDLAARVILPKRPRPPARFNLIRAAQFTFAINLILLGVTLYWIVTTAGGLGGLGSLVQSTIEDSLATRDVLLENKTFTGMRLFYAALPATGCLAAALLCARRLPRQSRLLCQITLLLNTAALFVLPIVMSQRLLLLQLLLSAYLAACLARRRLIALPWLLAACGLFMGLWFAREGITNPIHDEPAAQIALQKLAFYVLNDVSNSLAPLSEPIPHTYGKLTFEGFMFLTLTDGYFLPLLAPKLDALDPLLGGGEFPFFTSPFVDFGPLGAALLIALFGFLFRLAYYQARRSLAWAAIYAQIGAALLFSSHSVYVTHQNFLFSLILIGAITTLTRRRTRKHVVLPEPRVVFRSRRASAPPPPLTLPEDLMDRIAVFTTIRTRPLKKAPRHATG